MSTTEKNTVGGTVRQFPAPLIRALLDYVARYKFIYLCMYVCMYVILSCFNNCPWKLSLDNVLFFWIVYISVIYVFVSCYHGYILYNTWLVWIVRFLIDSLCEFIVCCRLLIYIVYVYFWFRINDSSWNLNEGRKEDNRMLLMKSVLKIKTFIL